MKNPFTANGDSFTFTYCGENRQAKAECLSDVNGLKRYKLAFPNIESIVEGSVYINETRKGRWMIKKIISAHAIPGDFLNQITQGFVEFINHENS